MYYPVLYLSCLLKNVFLMNYSMYCLFQSWVCWTLSALRLTGSYAIWARGSPRDSLETALVDVGAKSGFCGKINRGPGAVVPLPMFSFPTTLQFFAHSTTTSDFSKNHYLFFCLSLCTHVQFLNSASDSLAWRRGSSAHKKHSQSWKWCEWQTLALLDAKENYFNSDTIQPDTRTFHWKILIFCSVYEEDLRGRGGRLKGRKKKAHALLSYDSST